MDVKWLRCVLRHQFQYSFIWCVAVTSMMPPEANESVLSEPSKELRLKSNKNMAKSCTFSHQQWQSDPLSKNKLYTTLTNYIYFFSLATLPQFSCIAKYCLYFALWSVMKCKTILFEHRGKDPAWLFLVLAIWCVSTFPPSDGQTRVSMEVAEPPTGLAAANCSTFCCAVQ